MEAGPSRSRQARKPKAPHPGKPTTSKKKLAPPLPPPSDAPSRPGNGSSTLPIKTLQGVGTRRTDSKRPEYGREVVFVTRKSSLGMLLGRCKSLVMNEGYTRLTLHAMSAAIPQAILLLHALIDVLPYPRGKKGMWYEMRTGSVECVDEIEEKGSGMDVDGAAGGGEFGRLLVGVGSVEANPTKRVSRTTSTIDIILHIGPDDPNGKVGNRAAPGEGKARPNKRKRQALASAQKEAEAQNASTGGRRVLEMVDEEMLIAAPPSDEAQEEIE